MINEQNRERDAREWLLELARMKGSDDDATRAREVVHLWAMREGFGEDDAPRGRSRQ